ncbi:MAG TPA: tetratricopeptide repeat protein [Candidatus Sulfotelmatobacter sp.]|nr:tetratricopeptide repeat protein [Candidatus Sulfotelmatobacter sp.]
MPPALVRFGVFEADLRAGELRRNGIKVRLQDLPFRALTQLLARPGEVITREEFRQALWPPDVFVDFEQGISSAVMRLRDALRDSADNPIFIETIERRGYRWIGPIQGVEPLPDQGQEADSREQPSPGEKATPVAGPPPSKSFSWRISWRKMVFAFPLLALLFAVWIFRPDFRDARASAKSRPAATRSLHPAANREAEDLYLKGRFLWNKRTPESLNQALEAFTQAIAHDPNYSDAYVGLADCYNLLREFSAMPGNEAYFKAFAAAKKAVELDQQSSEAHASLAFVTFWGMWDAADAEKEFRRAIELDPDNAKAHHWYATFLHALGRHEEALSEIDLARKLAPDSSSILADKGELLWAAGHHEPALQLLKQLEATEPNSVSPHRYLRFAYLETGDYPKYIEELRKDALLIQDPAQSSVAEAAAKGFAQGGERGLFEAQLSEQKKMVEQGKLSPYFVAQTDARLANARESLKYLNICLQSHDERLLNLRADGDFAGLHGDAALQQLLAKIGLPPFN